MVSYGLLNESEEGDSSYDQLNIPQRDHQQQQISRKRTYPAAFPALAEEGRHPEVYPYNTALPVAMDRRRAGQLSFGVTMASLLDCFSTALSWMGVIGVRLFTTGIPFSCNR
jgi:hypothetical protein